MSTLNIRATSILQNPDPDTPVLSAVALQSFATIDARYLNLASDASISNLVASGTGNATIRTFNKTPTILTVPKFKADDGGYIYLDNSYLATQDLTANLINEPLTLVYVAKVFDWNLQKTVLTALSSGARLIALGGLTANGHRIVTCAEGVAVIGSGNTGTTPKAYISEKRAGWFCQLIHYNGSTVKLINSDGQMSSASITASAAIERLTLGAAVPDSTAGVEKVGLKYAAFRSGVLTDAELFALHDEVRLMFDL